MTLAKKMSIVVLTLLLIICIGSYVITLNNERNYFMRQMNSNAQDTATSLGLSLSHALTHKDKAMMLSMVEAVFDRGDFAMIAVRDIDGKLLVARYEKPAQSPKIPGWFIKVIQWLPAVQSSIIMSGWHQVGEVSVAADPSYAYNTLWYNALELVVWYALFAVLSLLIVYFFIHWLLRPLKEMRAQANRICQGEFPVQKNIPRTPELRQVTLAMNRMVKRIKRIFKDQLEQMERLREQSFQDPLTNLGNRRYFLEQLTSMLNNEEEFAPGFMLLVAVDGLDHVNKKLGFEQGDKILCETAKACANFWSSSALLNLSRISGTNFALVIRESEPEVFIKACNEFNQMLQKIFINYPLCQVSLGVTAYVLHQTPTELLVEADRMLKIARSETNKLAYSAQFPKSDISMNSDMIMSALSELRFSLFGQRVTSSKTLFHREVFIRINESGKQLSAGYFIPVAEKAGIAHLIDQVVLAKVLAANLLADNVLALNLTEETIINPNHRNAYLEKIQQLSKTLRERLHIEFNETVILRNFSKALTFVKALQKLGITIGIDQVGIHFSPMHYLNELPIDYVKLHGSLLQDVVENQNKQFFIHYFNEMAKTLGIKVIATQIETEAQWQALRGLGIKWGQGEYLSAIEPIVTE
ncbi:two component histidine kinase, GGDEF domain protein/EAL domain protein [Legionella lansingensis]|uniref:Two component histidine kinase n=1 Tax=Legionella lansingensis TaxID=45067 RepID=A0A0W0VZT1_9GAMM|nr:EAL domain-containing protein [Legionella lansingensis]KTD25685.1 two component histidine kinase [Legionella lansingensis]SNV49147.1 two component histidine kinase, GGDEF domain protein/EAL domain protein [Legionella lansingensis]